MGDPDSPKVRRLHRVLFVLATQVPSNWYESKEWLHVLDLVKRHLPARYRWALNRILAKEE